MKSFIVTHPEYGVFINRALGLVFWSKLDAIGQNSVIAFENIEAAAEIVANLGVPVDIRKFNYIEIEHKTPAVVSIEELRNVGLEDLIGHLGTGENIVGMRVRK